MFGWIWCIGLLWNVNQQSDAAARSTQYKIMFEKQLSKNKRIKTNQLNTMIWFYWFIYRSTFCTCHRSMLSLSHRPNASSSFFWSFLRYLCRAWRKDCVRCVHQVEACGVRLLFHNTIAYYGFLLIHIVNLLYLMHLGNVVHGTWAGENDSVERMIYKLQKRSKHREAGDATKHSGGGSSNISNCDARGASGHRK